MQTNVMASLAPATWLGVMVVVALLVLLEVMLYLWASLWSIVTRLRVLNFLLVPIVLVNVTSIWLQLTTLSRDSTRRQQELAQQGKSPIATADSSNDSLQYLHGSTPSSLHGGKSQLAALLPALSTQAQPLPSGAPTYVANSGHATNT